MQSAIEVLRPAKGEEVFFFEMEKDAQKRRPKTKRRMFLKNRIAEKSWISVFPYLQRPIFTRWPRRHADTARNASQCVKADRAPKTRRKRLLSAVCFVQVAEAKFRKIEAQFYSQKIELKSFQNSRCPVTNGPQFPRTQSTL